MRRRDRRAGQPALLVALGVFAVAMIAVLPAGLAVHPKPRAQVELASAQLTNDGAGALFPGVPLRPGITVTRCLTVTYSGGAGSGMVYLSAEALWGPLLPYLMVTVQVGSGGGFADCAGFSGNVIYGGPLAELAVSAPDPLGLDTGWRPPDSGDTRTFAISVTVADDNAAQGLTAGTTLRWALQPHVAPSTTGAPVAPADPPSAVASPPTPEASTPSPQLTSPPPAPAEPTPTGSPSGAPFGPSAPAPTSGPPRTGSGGGHDHSLPGRLQALLHDVMRNGQQVAIATAHNAAFPLLGLFVMLAFLLVQNRIDRDDPKLAVAPLIRRQYVHFAPDLTDQPVDIDDEEEI